MSTSQIEKLNSPSQYLNSSSIGKAMANIKKAKNEVSQNAQLLANRISLLKHEEEKLKSKIHEMQKKKMELYKIKKKNEEWKKTVSINLNNYIYL